MCLSVATSRKPLFTTAYKIMRKEYIAPDNKLYASSLYGYGRFLVNGEWNINEYTCYLPYSEYNRPYKSGFHSFVKLEDAIKFFEYAKTQLVSETISLYEVDTDNILGYGVEKYWYGENHINLIDVVVSDKIKFIQKIEV